ncbi:MAG: hypothetical protein ABI193_06090 [Minicystis sp.]
MILHSDHIDGDVRKPTREEIETLCVLHAVGHRACSLVQLASCLGLAPSLAPAIKVAIEALTGAGWLILAGEMVSRTDEGGAYLAARLEELQVCA